VTAADAFEYAVLRVVPRVDRGEAMNAGVVLYCRPRGYLGTRQALDEALLLALDPEADVPGVRRALDAIAAVCGDSAAVPGAVAPGGAVPGGAQPAAGPYRAGSGGPGVAGGAAAQDIGRRFRWLTAPRSTVVQAGPVHTGLTRDPAAEIDRLLRSLVLRPR
jgi:hypothetical protein